jgi:hypothetical protein
MEVSVSYSVVTALLIRRCVENVLPAINRNPSFASKKMMNYATPNVKFRL